MSSAVVPAVSVRRTLPFLGPAFIAAIAYVDPGNFATNFGAGARFGYALLWVIVAANLMAMLIQALSAKLGLATGADLATLCRRHLGPGVSFVLWIQAEVVAIATDLAEVVGGALALNLLFGLPLALGGVLTAAAAFLLLLLQSRGFRPFEAVITVLLLVIATSFGYLVLRANPDLAGAVDGLRPDFAGTESVVLATGILGATVMPHVIYVHSALTPGRYTALRPGMPTTGRREALRAQRIDLFIAMGLAGLINGSMLLIAARLFSERSGGAIDTLPGVHAGLLAALGSGAALAFGLALLASGLASSSVGTYAGQVVMAGFLGRQIPVLVRRLVTVLPALVVLLIGVDPTRALVWSQVVLSFGIPFALVPLVWLTSRADLMGELVNRRRTTAVACVVVALVVALNGFLIVDLAL